MVYPQFLKVPYLASEPFSENSTDPQYAVRLKLVAPILLSSTRLTKITMNNSESSITLILLLKDQISRRLKAMICRSRHLTDHIKLAKEKVLGSLVGLDSGFSMPIYQSRAHQGHYCQRLTCLEFKLGLDGKKGRSCCTAIMAGDTEEGMVLGGGRMRND